MEGGEDEVGDEGDEGEGGDIVAVVTVGREGTIVLCLVINRDAMSVFHV